MTLPVIGNTTAKLAISLTAGQAKTIGFAADVDLPEGTYTLTVGETDIPTTQDDARTLSVAFPAENAALLWQQWRLQIDGIDFAGGPIIETLPNNPVGDTTESLAVNLGDSVVNLTATIAAGGGGPVDADQVVTPTYTGRLAGIDPDVQSVLDMIDAGLDDHYVALFVADGDYSGGTLTAATLYDTGYPVPRENLVGALVCVVSGPDMTQLWTITASGPCTPGRAVDPGDVIRAYGQGLVALAGSSNGVDVSGINVAATHETVRGIGEDLASLQGQANDLADTAGTQGTTLDTLGNEVIDLNKTAGASSVGLDLLASHLAATPPTAWAACGEHGVGHWYCTTTIASPTNTLEVRSLARLTELSVDAVFAELYSECKDAGGVPEAGGIWDRFELAIWSTYDVSPSKRRHWLFWEYTEVGATAEDWISGTTANPEAIIDPAYACAGAEIPPSAWVEVMLDMDMAAGTSTLRVRSDTLGDFTAGDGTTWRTIDVYTTEAEVTSLVASDDLEQWVGRGGGRFDVARVRRWDDGVLVMDFNPSTAAGGDTTVTDAVLVDGSSDPAVWTARYDAAVVNP
jgi:hypothetical protein